MKVILMFCLLGLASAGLVPVPYASYGAVPHFGYQAAPVPYSAYQAPVPYAVYPAVHPGYVAKTPGAEHYAPLDPAHGFASHHINIKPAPGTE